MKEYSDQFNALLLQVPMSLAFILAMIGFVAFIVMFTQFGKTKAGMLFCIPGYTIGAIGCLSWWARLL